ncbi:allatostatin-A receptor-like [Oratosquilla oratoria]|uniref:allatostatin-A receptor-like n=1 Tax=Oratosquilla oratoria TaxID=337810 RepID=UPI003F76F22F
MDEYLMAEGEEGGIGDEYSDLSEEDLDTFANSLPKYYLCNHTSYTNLPLCETNSTTRPIEDSFEYTLILSIVVPIIFSIIVLVGLFGNTLVVIVIIVNKTMRSTTNYLIFSLAVADLLFIVFCVPFTASDYILSSWPFGIIWCKTVQYLTYVTAYTSVYTLLLLSLDRFLAVVHPIAAMSIRVERNAIYAIVGTWTIILTSCIPLYQAHGIQTVTLDGGRELYQHCSFLNDEYNHPAFQIGFTFTMYFVPLTVIVVLYLLILNRLWYGVVPGGNRSAENVRGKKRVTRMVVIVVVTFIVCWFPIQIVLLLKSLDLYKMSTPKIILQIAAQVLAYINSCVNPILYAFLSDPFRKAFRKVIACGPQRRFPATLNGRLDYEKSPETRPLNPRAQSNPITTTTSISNTTETNRKNNNSQEIGMAIIANTGFTNGASKDEAQTAENYNTMTTTTSLISTQFKVHTKQEQEQHQAKGQQEQQHQPSQQQQEIQQEQQLQKDCLDGTNGVV